MSGFLRLLFFLLEAYAAERSCGGKCVKTKIQHTPAPQRPARPADTRLTTRAEVVSFVGHMNRTSPKTRIKNNMCVARIKVRRLFCVLPFSNRKLMRHTGTDSRQTD